MWPFRKKPKFNYNKTYDDFVRDWCKVFAEAGFISDEKTRAEIHRLARQDVENLEARRAYRDSLHWTVRRWFDS